MPKGWLKQRGPGRKLKACVGHQSPIRRQDQVTWSVSKKKKKKGIGKKLDKKLRNHSGGSGIQEASSSNCHEGLEGSEDNKPDNGQELHLEEERDGPSAGRTSKRAIHNVEEGRAYLEEEGLINLGECIDLDAMAGTLIQLLVMEGTLAPVGLAVRAVALILAHMKMESVSKVLIKMMEPRMDSMMGKAVDKLVEDAQKRLRDTIGALEGRLGEAATSLAEGLGKTTEGLSENAVKIAESTGTYRDVLTKNGPTRHCPYDSTPTHSV